MFMSKAEALWVRSLEAQYGTGELLSFGETPNMLLLPLEGMRFGFQDGWSLLDGRSGAGT